MIHFFLGTHQPQWLGDERLSGVPLFISRRRLAERTRLPDAVTNFALDSGGFTELQMYGRWTLTPEQYAEDVSRYIAFYGKRLLWVAPQDWMCEPIVIKGGMAPRGVKFAGTHLSIPEHQRRTVRNFLQLRRLLGDRVIPVLQGWSMADYWRCQDLYKKAGVRLGDEPVVGVGTVCRRQSTDEAVTIMTTLASDGLSLHGFGLDSTTVLAIARAREFECYALSFNYGQRHYFELKAAARVAMLLGAAEQRVVRIELPWGGSALTESTIDVPKGRPAKEMAQGIPITYVPARNTVFLAYALSWAETLGAADIFAGMNAIDYSGYPDCRPEFVTAFQTMARLGTRAGIEGAQIIVHTPLIAMTKAQIIREGLRLGVDYGATLSCYDPVGGRPCGECDSCQLRAKGFEEAGLADPGVT